MDPLYQLQPIDAYTDHAYFLSRPEEYPESWSPVLGIEPRSQAQSSNMISPRSYYTAPDLRRSNVSSPQSHSYYSAISSPSYSTKTNTASTWSSNMSFPYSVTSINSRKSRKNVLYPRRTHPLPPPVPMPVPSENFPTSPGVRFCSSYFLQLFLNADTPARHLDPNLVRLYIYA